MIDVLRAVRRAPAGEPVEHRPRVGARRSTVAVADEIGALLTEATTVREYLSVTTGRVLAHLAGLRTALGTNRAGVDDLDAVLADFAAFAGLWHESIVRGPAWRIGDTGRRLERARVVIDLVEAVVAATTDQSGNPDIEAAAVEVLLAANESLVAYRRRHRSDVEFDAAISLLIHDDTNPLAGLGDRPPRAARCRGRMAGRARGRSACPGDVEPAVAGAAAGRSGSDRRGGDARDRALVLVAGVADPDAPHRGGGLVTDLVAEPEIDADVQRYRVEHRTSYSYGAAMTDGYTVACLVPRPRPWQQVLESKVSVEPHPSEHDSYLDAFGNLIHEFGVHEPHRAVTVTARSVVDLGTPDVPDDDTPWEGVVASLDQARGELAVETGFFRSASTFVDLADLGVALRSIAARSFVDGRSIIDGARSL